MTVEYFAPSIIIDGQTFTPEGWMWVLGLAIAGDPQSIEDAEKHNLWVKAKEWELQRRGHLIDKQIVNLQKEISNLSSKKQELLSEKENL